MTMKKKYAYINNQKIQFQRRILTGKIQKLGPEEKEQKRIEHDNYRTQYEKPLLGGYRMIYPCDQTD